MIIRKFIDAIKFTLWVLVYMMTTIQQSDERAGHEDSKSVDYGWITNQPPRSV
jgi:hypothetical protein